jgi:HPt (histidine-containing phosphotransfer) domain-containing protein
LHVHAVKSALASIGATRLSNAASALETAGKNEDISYIKSNNEKFLSELRELIRRIKKATDTGNEVQNNCLQIESIKPDLLSLKKSLNELDGLSMNQAIKKLKNNCKNRSFEDKIEALEQYILMCEYEEAAEYIDGLVSLDSS